MCSQQSSGPHNNCRYLILWVYTVAKYFNIEIIRKLITNFYETGGNPCTLPPETGPCRSHITRYYYNSKSRSCSRFTYGGCAGNANNFRTVKACRQICSARSKCLLYIDTIKNVHTNSLLGKACRYKGMRYQAGASFPSSNGCNKW